VHCESLRGRTIKTLVWNSSSGSYMFQPTFPAPGHSTPSFVQSSLRRERPCPYLARCNCRALKRVSASPVTGASKDIFSFNCRVPRPTMAGPCDRCPFSLPRAYPVRMLYLDEKLLNSCGSRATKNGVTPLQLVNHRLCLVIGVVCHEKSSSAVSTGRLGSASACAA
jgi:hypothetical protein